ncbi:sigma-70 family RNA polymerase sigma factor [Fulvimarina endophytica]|uniref:Sigma-70 family RNA polymerase sigma factor n=1 Tax=Fulvimarina endophytica TaxID=2293836 RepID=A0A371X2V5_9HYPH|nr:sigma-70 family RNA polymerase sigma factor [Fulvimarina endophytica]RFC63543.1 sigma-70 family RNA polymerase sigma factor [Fulvimarina endophytica]
MAASLKADELASIYLREWRSLLAILKRRTGSVDVAEEAVQETWLRIAGASETAPAILDRHAYLLRVAGNIAIDLLRRDRRRAALPLTDAVLERLVDAAPSPETQAIDRDELRALVEALALLPDKPRRALLMARCDQLTHAEIAERLGVSASMVAKYLVQALRHCRDHLPREN